ncbi:MAG: hypothetical protein D6741_09995, partial [Planctomycetota bacterium]
LYLLNSTHIQRKLTTGPKIRELLAASKDPRDRLRRIYLTILSRYPTQQELLAIRDYMQKSVPGARRVQGRSAKLSQADRKAAWQASQDLIWALINTDEFLCRH